jgi:hypothetical protein
MKNIKLALRVVGLKKLERHIGVDEISIQERTELDNSQKKYLVLDGLFGEVIYPLEKVEEFWTEGISQ